MKALTLIFFAMSVTLSGRAAPKEEITRNRTLRKDAITLFREQKPQQAAAHLKATVRSAEPNGDKDIAVAEELIAIANYFYNRREVALAVAAGQQGVAVADGQLARQAGNARLGMFYRNLGQMCETVLFDPALAKTYYQKALQMDGGSAATQKRLKRIDETLAAQSHGRS